MGLRQGIGVVVKKKKKKPLITEFSTQIHQSLSSPRSGLEIPLIFNLEISAPYSPPPPPRNPIYCLYSAICPIPIVHSQEQRAAIPRFVSPLPGPSNNSCIRFAAWCASLKEAKKQSRKKSQKRSRAALLSSARNTLPWEMQCLS